jgi:hypothetical protein
MTRKLLRAIAILLLVMGALLGTSAPVYAYSTVCRTPTPAGPVPIPYPNNG